jgi:hypothetical protein
MSKLVARTAALGILVFSIVGSAGDAAAAPTGGTSAADIVKTLNDMGYAVQINGSANQPLSQCSVTGVHGISNTDAAGHQIVPDQFSTAYVDVGCPGDS